MRKCSFVSYPFLSFHFISFYFLYCLWLGFIWFDLIWFNFYSICFDFTWISEFSNFLIAEFEARLKALLIPMLSYINDIMPQPGKHFDTNIKALRPILSEDDVMAYPPVEVNTLGTVKESLIVQCDVIIALSSIWILSICIMRFIYRSLLFIYSFIISFFIFSCLFTEVNSFSFCLFFVQQSLSSVLLVARRRTEQKCIKKDDHSHLQCIAKALVCSMNECNSIRSTVFNSSILPVQSWTTIWSREKCWR